MEHLKAQVAERFEQFSTWRMQDAQEFLACLMQCINRDMNRSKGDCEKPVISSRFSIRKQSQLWSEWSRKRDNSIVNDLF